MSFASISLELTTFRTYRHVSEEKEEDKKIRYLREFVSSISKERAFICFDLSARSFYLYFLLSPSPSIPPLPHLLSCAPDMYVESNISPSVFGGCISALNPILSRRQLQTSPITVSAMRELPFFGIACKYLDLILFAGNYAYPSYCVSVIFASLL